MKPNLACFDYHAEDNDLSKNWENKGLVSFLIKITMRKFFNWPLFQIEKSRPDIFS